MVLAICGKYGIQTYFKGNTIIKQTLMRLMDHNPKDRIVGYYTATSVITSPVVRSI